MNGVLERTAQYIREGVLLSEGTLYVDLSQPRTMFVRGVNAKTGEEKNYQLRITASGKLVLQ